MKDKDDIRSLILNRCLLESRSYTLSSGKVVDSYINLYKLILDPVKSEVLYVSLATKITKLGLHKVPFLAGRETAGALLASFVRNYYCWGVSPDRFLIGYRPFPVIVRKGKRTHGTEHLVECATLERGDCVIIDDVISTGESLLDTYQKLHYNNFNPVAAVCAVYRGLGGEEVAKRLGLKFGYLVRYDEKEI